MKLKETYENIVVGSGFGGAFAAYGLAKAGKEVLVVERGVWPTRDGSCWNESRLHLVSPIYRGQTSALVNQKEGSIEEFWPDDTVGGMSTFYGGAAFRMREDDFGGALRRGSPERDRTSAWPVRYRELEPFYDEAEKLQFVAGTRGEDITEPERKSDFSQEAPPLSRLSQRIYDAALRLGLHPFHMPMAINFRGDCGRNKCILCPTCDNYLCPIEAKNDLTVTVLPWAMSFGAQVVANTRAVRIRSSRNGAVSVDLIDQSTYEKRAVRAKHLLLAGGALSTPHLLLASGIDKEVPGGGLIGRYLMRHANGVVSALLPSVANREKAFHKQVSIPDFYFGDPEKRRDPPGAWGMIQQIHTPGKGMLKAKLPFGFKNLAALGLKYLANLLCIAEDVPEPSNMVYLDRTRRDKFGMPALRVYHRYCSRDLAARNALYAQAKRILRAAGALPIYCYHFDSFSHAIGTCRLGSSQKSSVVNPECGLWGTKNIYIVDGSVLGTVGSVNPSLTIAANSLRVASLMADS